MKYELNVCASTVRDWTIEFIDEHLNLFNLIFHLRTDEAQTFNSHVIKTILDFDWLRESENYSNRVRVHV